MQYNTNFSNEESSEYTRIVNDIRTGVSGVLSNLDYYICDSHRQKKTTIKRNKLSQNYMNIWLWDKLNHWEKKN